MIRAARPADIGELINLSLEALEIDAYEELRIDPGRVRFYVTEVVTAACNLFLVSEIDNEIVGGLAALITPNLFHERSQASILMWYCRSGGEGGFLMKRFLKWAQRRPMIKHIQWTSERKFDQRQVDFMLGRGFKNDMIFLSKVN